MTSENSKFLWKQVESLQGFLLSIKESKISVKLAIWVQIIGCVFESSLLTEIKWECYVIVI